MNLFGVRFLLTIIFEYEFLKTAVLLKLSPPWIRVVRNIGKNYSVKCEGKGQKIWRDNNGQTINNYPGLSIFIEKENDYSLILKIVNIRKEHKGMFNCTLLKTESRKQHPATFELSVIQPITLISNETTEVIILKEGNDKTLECNTEGEPPPIISWFFNDQLLLVEEGVEKSLLSINNVTPKNDGKYTCRAFQKISQTQDVELSFRIRVYQKPAHPNSNLTYDKTLTVYGFQNESRNLTCTVNAYPVAYFVWYKDNRPLDVKKNGVKFYNDENRSILEIFLDDINVLGLYECEAANSQDTYTQKIEYILVNTPQTPRLCYYERNDTSAIISVFVEPFPDENFTCKLEYTKFTWYKAEEKWKTAQVIFCSSPRIANTNKIHCEIRDLQPLTKYAVRAALRNQGGFGNFSNEIVFRTRSESSHSTLPKDTKTFLIFCLIIIFLIN